MKVENINVLLLAIAVTVLKSCDARWGAVFVKTAWRGCPCIYEQQKFNFSFETPAEGINLLGGLFYFIFLNIFKDSTPPT